MRTPRRRISPENVDEALGDGLGDLEFSKLLVADLKLAQN
jgi:hypothetical protein